MVEPKTMMVKYFIEELEVSPITAEEMYLQLNNHRDILNEFLEWLNQRAFPDEEKAITVEGYTARKLFESTYLEPIGAYNYLIYLREESEEALDNLKKGLPRK